jgi:hypothetical protein
VTEGKIGCNVNYSTSNETSSKHKFVNTFWRTEYLHVLVTQSNIYNIKYIIQFSILVYVVSTKSVKCEYNSQTETFDLYVCKYVCTSMYVCMHEYVCMYVCMYEYVCMSMYVCMYEYVCMYVRTSMYVCMYVCMYV